MIGKIPFIIQCRGCKEEHSIRFYLKDFNKWKRGELIQNAFPYLDSDERELLMSQTCGKCWEKMFKE